VVNEIEDLAAQTSKPTDIKAKIERIQEGSSSTLGSIAEIKEVINSVNEIVLGIATSVEEQTAATQEISRNINQASSGIEEANQSINHSSAVVGQIAVDIADVKDSVAGTTERSRQVKVSAEALSWLAENLNVMVGQFKV
jgi:methyl-accepting chemotaxis protein